MFALNLTDDATLSNRNVCATFRANAMEAKIAASNAPNQFWREWWLQRQSFAERMIKRLEGLT